MMGTFLETIKDARAKREAARQYVLAADRHRLVAREERAAGHHYVAEGLERLASDLVRNAAFEVHE